MSHEPTGEAAGLFGAVSEAYAAHRPTYPEGFFATFASRCPGRERVWDCGCGSGQASLALAQHFDQVVATDASREQLQLAPQHPRIRWLQAQAHCAPLDPASVDAVLVAAAVHWFAGEAFNAEVRRVARPGAVMAWIGYLPLQLEQPDLQRQLDRFYRTTLEPWWPPQRRWVDQSYAGLRFRARSGPSQRISGLSATGTSAICWGIWPAGRPCPTRGAAGLIHCKPSNRACGASGPAMGRRSCWCAGRSWAAGA